MNKPIYEEIIGKNKFEYFLESIGRIFDLSGSLFYNNQIVNFYLRNDLTPEQKDSFAIASDWGVVGNDLENAINIFKRNRKEG